MRLGSILVLFSFLNVQLLALIVGMAFLSLPIAEQPRITDNPADTMNSVYFFVQILVAAVLMLIILKFYKGKMLFRLLEFALIFITMWTFIAILTKDDLLGISAAAIACIIRWRYLQSRNPFMLFASAVIGALLGISLDIIPAAVLAVLLAGYDFVAVFFTKHMIKLAEGLRERGAAFSISFPSPEPAPRKVRKARPGEKTEEVIVRVRAETVELGTGDLVIPALLVVSALKISLGSAVAALVGAFAGIAILFYYIDRMKGYWPALPPIVGGTLVSLAAYTFLLRFL
ncbi:MAG: presenilin family intramembrane aspartyl protease [Candidatus Micrarchaeota archaeon]